MFDFESLKNAMADLEEDVVLEILEQVMADGGEEAPEAMKACQEGMNMVGERFESNEYFVSDLIFSGELMTEAMDIIKPALAAASTEKAGKMILCTVEGDLHDIGKNIVKAMLEAGGFEVVDLGIDVGADEIIRRIKEDNIQIIGLSGVLTLAIDSMKAVVDALEKEGLRDQAKVIIGGAPVTGKVCDIVGADAWAINPADTVKTCTEWAKGA